MIEVKTGEEVKIGARDRLVHEIKIGAEVKISAQVRLGTEVKISEVKTCAKIKRYDKPFSACAAAQMRHAALILSLAAQVDTTIISLFRGCMLAPSWTGNRESSGYPSVSRTYFRQ